MARAGTHDSGARCRWWRVDICHARDVRGRRGRALPEDGRRPRLRAGPLRVPGVLRVETGRRGRVRPDLPVDPVVPPHQVTDGDRARGPTPQDGGPVRLPADEERLPDGAWPADPRPDDRRAVGARGDAGLRGRTADLHEAVSELGSAPA